MKKLLLTVLMLATVTGLALAWSDNFTVTVTPVGDRGVIIDSSTYNFGNVNLNISTYVSTNAIPVTSTGNVTNIEYTIQGANAATWTLEADGVETPSANDKMVMEALFQDASTPAPNQAAFTSLDTVTTSAQQVGDTINFEGTSDMDALGLNVKKFLFFRVITPPSSTVEVQQSFTVTINAELGS